MVSLIGPPTTVIASSASSVAPGSPIAGPALQAPSNLVHGVPTHQLLSYAQPCRKDGNMSREVSGVSRFIAIYRFEPSVRPSRMQS